jgi:hypothetical protein
VLARHSKHFEIEKNGKPDSVSIDRLKPAFLENLQEYGEPDDLPDNHDEAAVELPLPAAEVAVHVPAQLQVQVQVPVQPQPPVQAPVQPQAHAPVHPQTRSGRVVRPRDRLNL